jgi:enterochelin esterase-like enzyme
MGVNLPSAVSSFLHGLENGTSAAGRWAYSTACRAEDEVASAMTHVENAPVLKQTRLGALVAGATEGVTNFLALDPLRVVGAVMMCANPVDCWDMVARVGIPALRILGNPLSAIWQVNTQAAEDFNRNPVHTAAFWLTDLPGAFVRTEEEATGDASSVRVQVVAVPGTNVSRPVIIYTPPGVENTKNLPILYYLHGTPGAPGDFLRAGGTLALNAWFKAGHKPFMVVEADGEVPDRQDSEWLNAANGNPAEQIESYFINSVIPAVEGDQPRSPQNRMIAGFSMGGYGAMNLAQHHPEVFGKVASLDGYYHVDDTDGMLDVPPGPNTLPDPGGPGVADASTVALNSPDQHVASLKGTQILLIHDTGDYGVSLGESDRFAKLLSSAGIPSTDITTGGNHTTLFLQANMNRLFQFMEGEPVSPGLESSSTEPVPSGQAPTP